jgi:hypothetical protein
MEEIKGMFVIKRSGVGSIDDKGTVTVGGIHRPA